MTTVAGAIKIFDMMTGPLKNITSSMNILVSTMHQMQNATNRNTNIDRQLKAAKHQIASAETAIAQAINQSTSSQNKFNRSVQNGNKSAGNMLSTIRNVAAAYLSFQGARSGMETTDSYVNTISRLNLINDGRQTTPELQKLIYGAADRARGSYSTMADAVGKMGLLASDAFGSNKELVRFTELMQKSFKVSGASTMEQQAGMYQLTQAMSAGKLQGDEFRSIMENAPMLAQAIAQYTGKTKGELKSMSAEGTITADIIKGAMFAAADDINTKFSKMPITFGDIGNRLKNKAFQSFDPVIRRINEFLNSPAGTEFANSVELAIDRAAEAVNRLFSVGYKVYKFMKDNWGIIEPIIWGIAAAIVYWTVVQWALNVALTANPIGLIIMAIAALIGIIVALVRYFINLWETNDKFAAGLFRAWNSILNFFDQIPIFFQIVGNGIVNAFQWAKVESLQLMEDLVNGAIDRINSLIDALRNIPGVSIDYVDKVEFTAKAAAEAAAIKQAGEEKVKDMRAAAAEKAADREQKVLDMLDDRAAKRARDEAEKNAAKPYDPDPLGKGAIPNINKVGEVGKIRDKVDISSEDLKTMRELAEMKNIQNFVTLTPTVQVTTGPVQNGYDIDTIVSRIETSLTEQIASSAQGVYSV